MFTVMTPRNLIPSMIENILPTPYLNQYCVIALDKPVLVTQFARGSRDDDNPFSTGDPMMTMVPQATNQFDSKFQFSTLQGIPGYIHYANIIFLADDNLKSDMISMAGCGSATSTTDTKG